jgi:hypothetical protein
MGKSESVSASIGIKILLSDIITQINETNFNIILDMLVNGFIEDQNDYFNEVYREIIDTDNIYGNYTDVKEYLLTECKNKGSYNKSKFNNYKEYTLDNGRLFEQHLLVPIKEILTTERWGYDRYGTNSAYRSLDFDLSANIDKYKSIENTELVFILGQHSG